MLSSQYPLLGRPQRRYYEVWQPICFALCVAAFLVIFTLMANNGLSLVFFKRAHSLERSPQAIKDIGHHAIRPHHSLEAVAGHAQPPHARAAEFFLSLIDGLRPKF